MNTTRPPRSARERILTRDDYRCVDCRGAFGRPPRRLPPSQLEVDHDIELTDGGTNDDDNLVTRCIPHHKIKTKERLMARTAAKTPTRTVATAQLPDAPDAPWRPLLAAAFFAAGAYLVASALAPDFRDTALAAGALLCALHLLVYLTRLTNWRRTCEAQRVYERLCKVAAVAPAARDQAFRVKAWRNGSPSQVAIRPGAMFDHGTKAAEATLATTFAAAIGAAEVAVGRRRHGWVTLTAAPPATPGAVDRDTGDDLPAAPTQEGRAAAATRLRDTLLPLVNGAGHVEVTAWWDANAPRAAAFTYAPSAARLARDARAELAALLTDVCPPRAEQGRWHVRWVAAEDRFALSDEPDPLAPVVAPPAVEEDCDLTAGPVVGVREDGDPWRLPVQHSHLLIAGATGAGKGSVLWSLIRGLEPTIRAGRCRLWVIDPKGGMELGAIESLAYRFATAAAAPELLEEAAAAMESQAQRLRARGLRKLGAPTVDMPLNVVIVDELAALTSLAGDARTRGEMNATMGRLLTQGRAVGFTVIGALQDPRQKNLDNRNLFPVAVALRLKERQMVDMVLGAGARASGAVCDLIPETLPGVGYVVADGQADTVRVRAAFVDDDEIARLTAAPAASPGHARPQTGEQMPLPDDRPAVPGLCRVDALAPGARVIFSGDTDPARVTAIDPDADDPDDRVEVTYVYDGETGERCASFDRDDTATVL